MVIPREDTGIDQIPLRGLIPDVHIQRVTMKAGTQERVTRNGTWNGNKPQEITNNKWAVLHTIDQRVGLWPYNISCWICEFFSSSIQFSPVGPAIS